MGASEPLSVSATSRGRGRIVTEAEQVAVPENFEFEVGQVGFSYNQKLFECGGRDTIDPQHDITEFDAREVGGAPGQDFAYGDPPQSFA